MGAMDLNYLNQPLPEGFHIGFEMRTTLESAGVRVGELEDFRPGENYVTFRCSADPASTRSLSVMAPAADDDNELIDNRTVVRTDEEWRAMLPPPRYEVLRRAGTERPFTGQYVDHFEDGSYRCGGCGSLLFDGTTKYDHGCGWPSFWDAVDPGVVELRPDYSHGMIRTEVVCATCGSHLGHLFDDGPEPTGQRYCINSVAIDFEKREPEA